MKISPAGIAARLGTPRRVGRHIEWRAKTASTNDDAWAARDRGEPSGFVIVAGEQTAGRGRHGRGWFSPAGGGLWLSAYLRLELPAERLPGPAVTAMLALAEALEGCAVPRPIRIRYPNDLLLGEEKVGGVLVETRWSGEGPVDFVVGIGCNLFQKSEDFPADLAGDAVSVVSAGGVIEDPDDLAAQFLRRWDAWLEPLLRGDEDAVLDAFRARSATLGRRVEVQVREETLTGVVREVDPLRGIVLRFEDGVDRSVAGAHVLRLRHLV